MVSEVASVNALFEAGIEIQHFLQERQWRFCLIGGLAVVRWGEIRATQDLDIIVLTDLGSEETYIHELLAHFDSRLADAVAFALKNRVLLISASNSVPIDISLGGIPFEEEVVSRARPFDFSPGVSLITCTAEDLIVLKAFADRPQDWLDIEGVLIRQEKFLDWDYIHRQLRPLCELKEAPEIAARLDDLCEKLKNE